MKTLRWSKDTARLLAAAFLVGICSVATGQTTVYSPRADDISLTIYRDGFALITETRTVDLPAEPVTVVFQGVVDALLSQSAVMLGMERPLAETNFAYDRLTPLSLLERSVGKTVTLVRTNRQTGVVTRTEVTIISVEDGVVLETPDGSEAFKCSGLPERLEFNEVPPELDADPTLSARLAAGAAGKRTVKVSYLAHGFTWSSDYVARVDPSKSRMDLTGWVTLRNDTNTSFRQAHVQVVAGKLHLLSQDEGGSEPPFDSSLHDLDETTDPAVNRHDRLRAREEEPVLDGLARLEKCFPLDDAKKVQPVAPTMRLSPSPVFHDIPASLSEVMVTGARVIREELGDYQLYRVPWPTDLNARQTKQAVFLSKPRVKVERIYSVRLDSLEAEEPEPADAPNVMLRWVNNKSSGLGEPLPAGEFRVFEPAGEGVVFAGEAHMTDKPVGLPVELVFARAMDLDVEYTMEELEPDEAEEEASRDSDAYDPDRIRLRAVHRFINNKSMPVTIEVRHAGGYGWTTPEVIRSNVRAGRRSGEAMFRLRVPAREERSLRYELQAESVYD